MMTNQSTRSFAKILRSFAESIRSFIWKCTIVRNVDFSNEKSKLYDIKDEKYTGVQVYDHGEIHNSIPSQNCTPNSHNYYHNPDLEVTPTRIWCYPYPCLITLMLIWRFLNHRRAYWPHIRENPWSYSFNRISNCFCLMMANEWLIVYFQLNDRIVSKSKDRLL